MKKILYFIPLTLVFLFCGTDIFSQGIYVPVNPTPYGSNNNRIKSIYVIGFPSKDTTINTTDSSAQIFYRPIDSTWWSWTKDNGYLKFGTSGSGGAPKTEFYKSPLYWDIDTLKLKTDSMPLMRIIGDTSSMPGNGVPTLDMVNARMGSGGSGGITADSTITASSGATTFTFTSVPATYSDYIIFVNGCKIRSATDYTTSGDVVSIPSIVDGDIVEYQRIK